MSAVTVIDKIQEKAAAEAAAIRKNAEEKALAASEAILSEAKAKAKNIKRGAEEQAERLVAAEKQQSGLEARISYLNEKRRLLIALRRETAEQMCGFDENKTAELLTKLVLEIPLEGEVFVGASAKDAILIREKGLLANWKHVATEKYGRAVEYKLSEEPLSVNGGLVLYGTKYDVDLTYDTLIDAIFEAHEKEIADCLFKSGS
jgi:ATP synthase, subunit E